MLRKLLFHPELKARIASGIAISMWLFVVTHRGFHLLSVIAVVVCLIAVVKYVEFAIDYERKNS